LTHRLVAGALSLLLAVTPAYSQSVTIVGDVDPTGYTLPDWTVLGEVNVGRTGIGSLSIEGGATLTSYYGFVGYDTGSSGVVTVTGSGSLWTVSEISVGIYGTGVLTISDAGKIDAEFLYIASSTGSTGTVTVDGAGSVIDVSSDISVGSGGDGSLLVQNGGAVTGHNAYVGDYGGTGDVIVSGPASSWTASGEMHIGFWGNGTLRVDSGATVSGDEIYAGYGAGMSGTMTVTGSGSSLSAAVSFLLGLEGQGSLIVSDGASASAINAYIGSAATASGTATVTGTGSSLTLSDSLYLGVSGQGTLILADGASLASQTAYLGYNSGGTGSAVIGGAGSSWTNSGTLHVGYDGTGSLIVADGASVTSATASVTSAAAYLGYSANGSGTVTVTGSGSSWGISGDLYVGYNGTGELTIENGGSVSVSNVFLANGLGTTGTLTVSGAGSQLIASGEIDVGVNGVGSLIVEAGGVVESEFGIVGVPSINSAASDPNVFGVALVSGSGSRWTMTETLTVGFGTTGTSSLTIADGGLVDSARAIIGRGGSGAVTVTGSGSSFAVEGLRLGLIGGTGSLLVEDGGALSASAYVWIGDDQGTGTVTVTGQGSVLSALSVVLGTSTSTSGTLSVADGGTVSVDGGAGTLSVASASGSTGAVNIGSAAGDTAQAAGNISAAQIAFGSGHGTLLFNHTDTDYTLSSVIVGSGTIRQLSGYTSLAGNNTAASQFTGTVSVEGGVLSIDGNFGDLVIDTGNNRRLATVNVSGSGVLTGTGKVYGFVSLNDGGTVAAGAGSDLKVTSLYIGGSSGQGNVSVTDGGQLTVPNGFSGEGFFIGYGAGTTGIVTVTGSGSVLNTVVTWIGYEGAGSLTIADGGTVVTTNAAVITAYDAESSVMVTGAGSTWTVSGSASNTLSVGDGGHGYLTIQNGGTVTLNGGAGTVKIGYGGLDSALIIGAAAGDTAVAAGTLNAATVSLTEGAGQLVFNHTGNVDGSDYTFNPKITGAGSIRQLAGKTILTGVNTTGAQFTGTVSVEGGSLLVNGVLGDTAGNAASVTVSGGTLSGSGTIAGSVAVLSGGTLSGQSGQTLTINGNLALSAGATIDASLGSSGNAALFSVGGNLTLDGTLDVSDAGGFGPGVYNIIDYAGTLADNGLTLGTLPSGTNATLQTAVANEVNLVVTSVSGGSSILFWNGSTLAANGQINGGSGTWSANPTNWTDANGATAYSWSSAFAVFQNNAGTVTVSNADGGIAVTGMQFVDDGWRIEGESVELAGSGGVTTIRVGDGSSAGAASTATIASDLSGPSTLRKTDLGTLVLAGDNDYDGGTEVVAGTLVGNTRSIRGAIANAGTIVFDQASDDSYSGSISGYGGVQGQMVKRGAGMLTLTGLSDLDWTVEAGWLVSQTGLFQGDVAVDAGATFAFDQSTSGIYSGTISGNGGFAITGGGTVILTGDNTQTGGTTIASGSSLQIGNGGTAGSLTGAVETAGTLLFDRSDSYSFAGQMTGAGDIRQVGSGTTILSGANTAGSEFTGSVSIESGTLLVNGVLGDTVNHSATVSVSGGTLGGSGEIAGSVTVLAGGALSGQSGQTLAIDGDLTLSSGAVISASLGSSSGAALFSVGGDLTLDGTLNVTDAGGFGVGVYRLFDYGGSLTDNGLTVGSLPSGTPIIQTALANQVNLVVSSGSGSSIQFWNGTTMVANGTINGGSGTWSAAAGGFTNWTDTNATASSVWSDLFAVFQNNPGVVTVDASFGAISVTGMQFIGDGWTISGDAVTLAGTGGTTTIRVGDGTTSGSAMIATIASELTGSSALLKDDYGTLVLTGNNSYTGGTQVAAGTLIGSVASIRGDIANAGTVVFDQGTDATLSVTITAYGGVAGQMVKRGGGTLTLTGLSVLDWSVEAGVLVSQSTIFSGDLSLSAGAGFVFNQTVSGIYGGDISGAGTLTITGGGTVILTGDSSHTGGTAIVAGSTLQVGDGGTSGSLSGDVAVDGTLAFDRSDALTFSGLLSGSGAIRQLGSGRTVLTGNSSGFAGTTTVEDGILVVNGALGGDLVVLSSGRLQGSGTVANLSLTGTLAPGNSIGTLSVAGNLTINAGSVYEVEVDAAGNSDKIQVGGTATLNGEVNVLAASGTYAASTVYTILTATGGIAGSFDSSVDTDLAFLDGSLSYDANNVYLTLLRNSTGFADIGTTANQIATGSATETLGSGNVIYDSVVALSTGDAQEAFDQLSGEIHASIQASRIEESASIRQAVWSRMRVWDSADEPAVWSSLIVSKGSISGDGNASTLDRSASGGLFGIDGPVFDHGRFGAFAGYSHSEMDVADVHSSASSENVHFGVYGSLDYAGLSLRSGLAYSHHDTDTTRNVSFTGVSDQLTADYTGSTVQAFSELAYTIDLDGGMIEPFANIARVHVASDGFTETGEDAALEAENASSAATYATLGLRGASEFSIGGVTIMGRGSIGWRHAVDSESASSSLMYVSGSDGFTIHGVTVAEDLALLEAGFDLNLSPTAALGITYSGQFGSDYSHQALEAKFRLAF
jgi:outer membrane autotransporter protein